MATVILACPTVTVGTTAIDSVSEVRITETAIEVNRPSTCDLGAPLTIGRQFDVTIRTSSLSAFQTLQGATNADVVIEYSKKSPSDTITDKITITSCTYISGDLGGASNSAAEFSATLRSYGSITIGQ